MRKINFKVFDNFEDLRKDYEDDVFNMTPSERLSVMEELRRDYFRVKGLPVVNKVERKLEIITRRVSRKR